MFFSVSLEPSLIPPYLPVLPPPAPHTLSRVFLLFDYSLGLACNLVRSLPNLRQCLFPCLCFPGEPVSYPEAFQVLYPWKQNLRNQACSSLRLQSLRVSQSLWVSSQLPEATLTSWTHPLSCQYICGVNHFYHLLLKSWNHPGKWLWGGGWKGCHKFGFPGEVFENCLRDCASQSKKRLDKGISKGDLVGRLAKCKDEYRLPIWSFQGLFCFLWQKSFAVGLLSFSSKTKQSVWNIGIAGLCWVCIPLQITHWTIVADKLRVQKKSKPNCWLRVGGRGYL